ncbi:hypothetical protein P5V15_004567 [Pogonomyrmex californicus]
MGDTKPKIVPAHTKCATTDDQYAASYLKTGSMRGVMYQMGMLTWASWRLTCQKDANIRNWWLAAEVRDARGFHDLVLKYSTNGAPKEDGSTSDGEKYMYRFMQIKHKTSLQKNATITDYHLVSKHKLHRQSSLFYLFRAYLNLLGNYEKITPEQIVDLMIFTNMNIKPFKFLVPVENDPLFGFKGKGKRYRLDINALRKEPGIMIAMYNINQDEKIIVGFLKKLVFVVCQPSEPELEELIVEDMGQTFNSPEIFYDNLYKNIINWFLVYKDGRAPYLTENHVMEYLKKTQDTLWEARKSGMLVDPVSKLSEKLKFLHLSNVTVL